MTALAGGGSGVEGHFVRHGSGWRLLPSPEGGGTFPESITSDDVETLAAHLQSNPSLIERQQTFLYWQQDPQLAGSMGGATPFSPSTSEDVAVRTRSPLQLAAQAGSVRVASLLLHLGADASARSLSDSCTALQVGDYMTQTLRGRSDPSRSSSAVVP